MGWKETGDDRAKRFQAYKDLEAKLTEAHLVIARLTEELASRDITVRTLAKELYRATEAGDSAARMVGEDLLDSPSTLPATPSEEPPASAGPKRTASGTMQRPDAPKSLAELFGQTVKSGKPR